MTYYTPPQPRVKTAFDISFDVEKFMSKFKLVKSSTLFEPTKDDIVRALIKRVCPLCSCKLYQSRDKRIWRCKSVRRDRFVVRDEVISKYK